MKVHKLNESYSAIEADSPTINKLNEFLKVQLVKYKKIYGKNMRIVTNEYFASIQNDMLLVKNGHLQTLKAFGVLQLHEKPEFSDEEINEFFEEFKSKLPFVPHDFQEKAFKDSVRNFKQINKMCTSAGKSLTITAIAEFFKQKGKKGLLLVPNINLLSQFKDDIKEYGIIDLYNETHTIGGGTGEKSLHKAFTISTWQSMQNYKEDLHKLDYVICDECLHPETLIKTNEGLKQIQNLKIGDEVLTINEKTKKYEYKPIKKVHKNLMISSKEKMYELTLENGNTIKITGNHKVLTKNGWVRTDELTLDDDILDLGDYNVQI